MVFFAYNKIFYLFLLFLQTFLYYNEININMVEARIIDFIEKDTNAGTAVHHITVTDLSVEKCVEIAKSFTLASVEEYPGEEDEDAEDKYLEKYFSNMDKDRHNYQAPVHGVIEWNNIFVILDKVISVKEHYTEVTIKDFQIYEIEFLW